MVSCLEMNIRWSNLIVKIRFDSLVFLWSSFINVINWAFVPFHVGILIDVFYFETCGSRSEQILY